MVTNIPTSIAVQFNCIIIVIGKIYINYSQKAAAKELVYGDC